MTKFHLLGIVCISLASFYSCQSEEDLVAGFGSSFRDSRVEALAPTLANEGLTGLVHGADHLRGVYVFTYSDPNDFFLRFNFSLTVANAELRETLRTLNRGDRIRVVGQLGSASTSQPHIEASRIEMIREYDPGVEATAGEFQRETVLPDDLPEQSQMTAMVHAVADEGRVIVLEYRDAVIPLVVSENEYTRDLYRGDLVQVHFGVQSGPRRPTHLYLKPLSEMEGDALPLTVLERFHEVNNQEVQMEGRLVLFPISPTINRDIWAVEQDLGNGLFRYFTLVNFELNEEGEFEEFDRIGDEMRMLWDSAPDTVYRGRNKFVNVAVRIRARGRVSLISANQANAQIRLTADSIEAIE